MYDSLDTSNFVFSYGCIYLIQAHCAFGTVTSRVEETAYRNLNRYLRYGRGGLADVTSSAVILADVLHYTLITHLMQLFTFSFYKK